MFLPFLQYCLLCQSYKWIRKIQVFSVDKSLEYHFWNYFLYIYKYICKHYTIIIKNLTFDRLQDKQRELGINKRKKRKSVAKKHLIRFLRLFAWLWSVNIGFLLISEFLLTYLNLLIQSIIQYFLKNWNYIV